MLGIETVLVHVTVPVQVNRTVSPSTDEEIAALIVAAEQLVTLMLLAQAEIKPLHRDRSTVMSKTLLRIRVYSNFTFGPSFPAYDAE